MAGLAACNGPEDPWGGRAVAVEPASATVEAGLPVQFHLVARDDHGRSVDTLDAYWEASDHEVALVTVGGLTEAKGPGVARIQARALGSPTGPAYTATLRVEPLRFRQISAGKTYTCGVTERGTGYCWGRNIDGEVGDGTMDNIRVEPTPVAGGLAFRSISAGSKHTCGVTTEGIAYCWGWNVHGRLGDGAERGYRLVPTRVATFRTFESIAVGGWFTCGLAPDGVAYCWGENEMGELGIGSFTAYELFPAPVAGGLTFASISAGTMHVCALTFEGVAYCWGRNDEGRLGDGTLVNRATPTEVEGGHGFQSISVDGGYTCGVTTAGILYCWGSNHQGRLGIGLDEEDRVLPTRLATAQTFQQISTGTTNACALTTAGEAYCWGFNLTGAVGQDPAEGRVVNVPVPVIGGHVFGSIGKWGDYACGLATDDIVYCWGANSFGQFGIGEYSTGYVGSYEPVPVMWQR